MSNSTMMAIVSDITTTIYKDVSHKDRSAALLKANDARTVIISDNSSLLRVTPTWHNIKITITKGAQAVPSDLLEWRSFQALVRKGLISIVDKAATEKVTKGKPVEKAKEATKPKAKRVAEDLVNAYDPSKGPVRID